VGTLLRFNDNCDRGGRGSGGRDRQSERQQGWKKGGGSERGGRERREREDEREKERERRREREGYSLPSYLPTEREANKTSQALRAVESKRERARGRE
jgi:hypothetical protein